MQSKSESKEDLKKRLTPIQYEVTQNSATERPFTSTLFHDQGEYNKCKTPGTYLCVVCSQPLFNS
jgi:peptide methionine sulfoxide reductase MsrB